MQGPDERDDPVLRSRQYVDYQIPRWHTESIRDREERDRTGRRWTLINGEAVVDAAMILMRSVDAMRRGAVDRATVAGGRYVDIMNMLTTFLLNTRTSEYLLMMIEDGQRVESARQLRALSLYHQEKRKEVRSMDYEYRIEYLHMNDVRKFVEEFVAMRSGEMVTGSDAGYLADFESKSERYSKMLVQRDVYRQFVPNFDALLNPQLKYRFRTFVALMAAWVLNRDAGIESEIEHSSDSDPYRARVGSSCAQCGLRRTPLRCGGPCGGSVVYCSRACAKRHWASVHHRRCH